MDPRKWFALLFLSALAFCEYAEGGEKIGTPVAVNVDYPAKVAVPIQFTSGGYAGPYDPADPKGVLAAQHRNAKLARDRTIESVKSYVPPGVGSFVKKETVKVAVKEGERFALSHPSETADLIGIATKAKHLYHSGSSKLKKATKSK